MLERIGTKRVMFCEYDNKEHECTLYAYLIRLTGNTYNNKAIIGKVRAISAKEGYKKLKARGLDANDDCQITFFAIDDEAQEIYEFDTKIERDNFVRRHKDGKKNLWQV